MVSKSFVMDNIQGVKEWWPRNWNSSQLLIEQNEIQKFICYLFNNENTLTWISAETKIYGPNSAMNYVPFSHGLCMPFGMYWAYFKYQWNVMWIYSFNFHESFSDFAKDFSSIQKSDRYKINRKYDVFIYFSMTVISLWHYVPKECLFIILTFNVWISKSSWFPWKLGRMGLLQFFIKLRHESYWFPKK